MARRPIEILARYDDRRTNKLKQQQAREMEKWADSGIDPTKLEEKGSDPPASLALTLVAVEGSMGKKDIELPGSSANPDARVYKY